MRKNVPQTGLGFLLGFIFTLALPTFAESDSGLSCPVLLETDIEFSQARDLTFKSVEVFRRNNNVGIQQVGPITFKQWLDLPSTDPKIFNYVGRTEAGEVFHLVHYGQRVVARLLSGRNAFADIVLIQGKVLGAVDSSGQVWLYSSAQWNQSPRPQIIKSALLHWAGISGAMFAAIATVAPDVLGLGPEVSGITLSVPLSTIAVGSALNTTLLALMKYDRLNTFPDGFIRTRKTLAELNGSDLSFKDFDFSFPGFNFDDLPAVVTEAQEPIHR